MLVEGAAPSFIASRMPGFSPMTATRPSFTSDGVCAEATGPPKATIATTKQICRIISMPQSAHAPAKRDDEVPRDPLVGPAVERDGDIHDSRILSPDRRPL